MDTVVVRGGKFTFTLTAKELARGLRPSSRSPRNSEYLVECIGAVGRDGVLSALESLTRFETPSFTGGFPYPQLFICTSAIIVCDPYNIYELQDDTMVLKYTATDVAWPWTVVDFFDYIYISNGFISVVRDPFTREYSLNSDLPAAISLCNYNGQVLAGSPDVVDINTIGILHVISDSITNTVSLIGTIAIEEFEGQDPSEFDIFIYNFDEGAGQTTYIDETGFTNVTATDNCAATETWSAFGLSSLMVGSITSASSNFTIAIPSEHKPTGDWTVHMRLYIDQLPEVGPAYYLEILNIGAVDPYASLLVDIANTGSGSTTTLTGYEADGVTSFSESLPEFSVDTAYHVAMVYKDNAIMFFVDGIKVLTHNCVSSNAFANLGWCSCLDSTGRYMIDGLELTAEALWDVDFTVPTVAPPNY